MGKGVAVGVLVLLLVGGIAGYYAYTNYLLGKVVLNITDPPGSPATQSYSSNISHIYLTYTSVEIHTAAVDNTSNVAWHRIVGAQTIDLLTVLNVQQTLGSIRLSPGKYDQIRMFTNTTTVTINGTNYSYNIPSGKIQVIITGGGGFQITVGQTVKVLLTISFNDSEIMTHGPNLSPVARADVLS